jgi:hypothetical protein
VLLLNEYILLLISLRIQSGNFWIHPRMFIFFKCSTFGVWRNELMIMNGETGWKWLRKTEGRTEEKTSRNSCIIWFARRPFHDAVAENIWHRIIQTAVFQVMGSIYPENQDTPQLYFHTIRTLLLHNSAGGDIYLVTHEGYDKMYLLSPLSYHTRAVCKVRGLTLLLRVRTL